MRAVLFYGLHNQVRFLRCDRLSKYISLNRMDEFYALERSEPNLGSEYHSALDFQRVPVLKVMSDEEATAGIDIQ